MGFWDSTSAPRVAVCARLRLTQRRPLIDVQDAELALIDRRPVVLEEAAVLFHEASYLCCAAIKVAYQ